MDNASKNASDMINRLTLQYNRGRQAAITNELVDIITGTCLRITSSFLVFMFGVQVRVRSKRSKHCRRGRCRVLACRPDAVAYIPDFTIALFLYLL